MAVENSQKRSQRIVLIASDYTIYHYSCFLRHLLVGLADESIPVALVCPQKCNIDSIVLGAVEIIRYPVLELPFTEFFNRKILIDQITKFKPTMFHCLCESRASVTKYLARRLDLPYVLTVNSLQSRFGRLPISHNHCIKIIVPSKIIADGMIKKYSDISEHIQQINYGMYSNSKLSCFNKHSRYTTIVMAYPSKHKDEIENVFGSLRHLKIDGYEFILFLINSGFQRPKTNFLRNQSNLVSKSKRAEEKIFKALNALDLVQDVTMVPMQIPWRIVLSSGDVFINPMPNCSFNSLLLEAMSIGAAVASVSGGVDDLIIEDQTAVILEMNDELSIMRSLQKLLDRHEFAQKIAQNAQDYVKKHHSVSNMISDILQIYNETES